MNQQDINTRFDFNPDSREDNADKHAIVRNNTKLTGEAFDDTLPEGREKSLALTKLEEALFWANAAIARNGFGESPEPTRKRGEEFPLCG